MQKPADRPWVIAHRGASHAMRENTAPGVPGGIRPRGRCGRDWTCGAPPTAPWWSITMPRSPESAPIIELDRAPRSRAPHRGSPIWTHALAACAGMWVNVEIKNSPADPDWDESHRAAHLTAAILREVRPGGPLPGVVVQPGHHRRVRNDLPRGQDRLAVRCRHRTAAGDPTWQQRPGMPRSTPTSTPWPGRRPKPWWRRPREAGLLVIVWTVDDTDEMLRLAAAGVDGIITNRPVVGQISLRGPPRRRRLGPRRRPGIPSRRWWSPSPTRPRGLRRAGRPVRSGWPPAAASTRTVWAITVRSTETTR